MISRIVWNFSCVAVAYKEKQYPTFDFYGCDGINGTSVGGYKSVFMENIYGKRIDRHFHCGHNLSQDAMLLMVLRAIGGLAIEECISEGLLTEPENKIGAEGVLMLVER